MAVMGPTHYAVTGEQAGEGLLAGGPPVVPVLLVGGIMLAVATGAVFGGPRRSGRKA